MIIKLIVPFGFESSLSPLGLFAPKTDKALPVTAFTAVLPSEPEINAGQSLQDVTRNITEVKTGDTSAQVSAETQSVQTVLSANITPLDWTEWALIVWAAGAAITIAAMSLCAASLKRRARHARLTAPERAARLFAYCRQEIGIKRRVDVLVQSALKAPFVMGSFKPVLVLPEDIDSQTDAQIRHICLHELTHIKYGDTASIALMNILRAVYWFNPLVWLCFAIIRKDMEAACDARVLRRIGASARQDYIGTVLRFARRESNARLQAAMGMADGRTSMEQRIRGMFRQAKTGRKGRVVAAGIAVIMLAMSALSACQPTPEEEIVVNKGGSGLEDKIASPGQTQLSMDSANGASEAEKIAALRELAGAPETFTDSYTNEKGNVTVTIDAQVQLPPADSVPALAVTFCAFSQEQVDRFAEYFLKGQPVFTEEQIQTGDDIMSMIVWRRKEIELAKQNEVADQEGVIADLEARITELEKEYIAAPDERERTPADTQLQTNAYGSGLDVAADLGKGNTAGFRVNNSGEYGSSFRFVNDGLAGFSDGGYDVHSPGSEEFSGTPRGMTTTTADARATVEQCLADLGIDDMQIESVGASTFYKDINDRNDKDYKETAPQCYVFTLVRKIQGIPVASIEPSVELSTDDPNVTYQEQPDYEYIADPEYLLIYVDDTGIVQFIWSNPIEITSVMSAQVTLTPFEDIVKHAKDNMFFKVYTAYDDKVEISITSIRLSMMRIMRKDSPGESLLVPVWDFIGNTRDITDDQTGEWSSFKDQSFVTINAIDGSNINRDWGY